MAFVSESASVVAVGRRVAPSRVTRSTVVVLALVAGTLLFVAWSNSLAVVTLDLAAVASSASAEAGFRAGVPADPQQVGSDQFPAQASPDSPTPRGQERVADRVNVFARATTPTA
jgi:hypothetical protein